MVTFGKVSPFSSSPVILNIPFPAPVFSLYFPLPDKAF
jgi:hypothetical protein